MEEQKKRVHWEVEIFSVDSLVDKREFRGVNIDPYLDRLNNTGNIEIEKIAYMESKTGNAIAVIYKKFLTEDEYLDAQEIYLEEMEKKRNALEEEFPCWREEREEAERKAKEDIEKRRARRRARKEKGEE